MADESYAHLPSGKVRDACNFVLRDIEESRYKLKIALAVEYRRTCIPFVRRSVEQAVERMPDDVFEIVRLHREDERITVSRLRDLAQAAEDSDGRFRIHVSAVDFSKISRHYIKSEDML